jgi:hypothetical protein
LRHHSPPRISLADSDVQAELDRMEKELQEPAGEVEKLAGVVAARARRLPAISAASVADGVRTPSTTSPSALSDRVPYWHHTWISPHAAWI